MKKFLLSIFLLFSFVGISQITIDDSLTAQQLVEDILINSTCADVSNFVLSTGTNFGQANGIGAFDANGSGFPFASGIILTSGDVNDAPGPNGGTVSVGTSAWEGDTDLETILGVPANSTNNASFLEFDFVPNVDEISFNFIMASEEYNQNFECTFSDAFAFILTDQATGVVQNLAVLPGTTTPIQVTNIRYEVPSVFDCNAVNEEYFQQYNDDYGNPAVPFVPAATAPIEYNGQTVSLTAMGSVIAGNPYTIKLVVADDGDSAFDFAVFLEEGSFNLGVDLGPDVTIDSGNAPCEGEEYTIGVANPTAGTTYQWYVLNTTTGMYDILPGETNSTLVVTTEGTYQVETSQGSGTGCGATDEVFVEFSPPLTVNDTPSPLVFCDSDSDGFGEFFLHDADADITGGDPDLTVTYHGSLLNAE
ncbi:choice-of-anchor L domain-containing protein, partial [Flavobacteriaceae bacterium TK19130]|nr:choice-of-anchor L domain-containing protein [Thermobacterium salinum]